MLIIIIIYVDMLIIIIINIFSVIGKFVIFTVK